MALLVSCSAQNPKSRFLLAEKLWQEGKYQAAVSEYERVIQKEQGSELGLQAAYRAAMTEMLFLQDYTSALKKLTRIIELSRDSPLAHDAQKQIGEILFVKLEQFEQAVSQYQKLLELYPEDPSQPEYWFRIGKSYYFMTRFDQSIATYETLRKKFPKSEWAERALFEMGTSSQTLGNQRQSQGGNANEAFKEAMSKFTAFAKEYPSHALAPQARFEAAACLEELDQLDAAQQAYENLRSSYPNPQVIDAKLGRIKDRKTQKRQ